MRLPLSAARGAVAPAPTGLRAESVQPDRPVDRLPAAGGAVVAAACVLFACTRAAGVAWPIAAMGVLGFGPARSPRSHRDGLHHGGLDGRLPGNGKGADTDTGTGTGTPIDLPDSGHRGPAGGAGG